MDNIQINLDILRKIIQEDGRPQRVIARAAGITPVTLSRWVTQKREPRKAELERLAEALGVQIADLYQPAETLTNEQLPPEQSLEHWRERALKAEKKLEKLEAAAAAPSDPLSGMSAEEYLTKLRSSLQFVFNFITQEASK